MYSLARQGRQTYHQGPCCCTTLNIDSLVFADCCTDWSCDTKAAFPDLGQYCCWWLNHFQWTAAALELIAWCPINSYPSSPNPHISKILLQTCVLCGSVTIYHLMISQVSNNLYDMSVLRCSVSDYLWSFYSPQACGHRLKSHFSTSLPTRIINLLKFKACRT